MTLKDRIDKLVNSLGGKPLPAYPDVRADLVKIAHLVELLESGQSAVQADLKISGLEATVSELQSQIKYVETQRDDFTRLLDSASAEMERVKKEQDENEPLSTIERRVVYYLDSMGDAYGQQIAEFLNKGYSWIEDMLDRMVDSKVLSSKEERGDIAPRYFLTKKAKAWLVKNRGELYE